jgi:hypothetical protein
MGPKPKSVAERFSTKFYRGEDGDCWEWRGSRNADGYGILHAGQGPGKFLRAHRVSWEVHCGHIPGGLSVLHRCDNPPCVNPAHLYVGTQQQNVIDRANRKRGKENRQDGSANDNAKLTEADVIAIRELVAFGFSQAAVARSFGIRQAQVSRIHLRQSWRHLD